MGEALAIIIAFAAVLGISWIALLLIGSFGSSKK